MPDSIRKIYSVTKLFTAVSVMKLIEDDLLYLEQPVMSVIEEFNNPVHSKINIFHLLTHTSGMCPDSGYFNEPANTPAFHWGANYQGFRHGLGFNLLLSELLSPDTFNHEGYGRSALYMDPTEKLAAVYSIPADGDWLPEAMINPRAIIWSGLL